MPVVKQRIEEQMKREENPLVYLEYTPEKKLKENKNSKELLTQNFDENSQTKICMGFVSRPYKDTYRITTCRHLITDELGRIPSKIEILNGLEVFARYEGINKRFHSFMFEDVNIKVHEDGLTDLLFIEITRPDNYNFQLLNHASLLCKKRFPGSKVYYFQNNYKESYFRLFEGEILKEKIYIIEITNNGNFLYFKEKPTIHHRVFHTIDTISEILIQGASGSPIVSRKGEVVGMICAHQQTEGKGIYLSVEKIERLYDEIENYHI